MLPRAPRSLRRGSDAAPARLRAFTAVACQTGGWRRSASPPAPRAWR